MHEIPLGDPLTVFISARLQEMAAERAVAGAIIAAMRLRPVVFEHTRPALGTRPVFLEAARTCDIFVGVYGDEYGDPVGGRPAPIEQEYLETMAAPFMPRLLFVRTSRSRQRRLQAFLRRAAPHAAVIPYMGHADFALRLRREIAVVLAAAFREAQMPATEQRAQRARTAGTATGLAGGR